MKKIILKLLFAISIFSFIYCISSLNFSFADSDTYTYEIDDLGGFLEARSQLNEENAGTYYLEFETEELSVLSVLQVHENQDVYLEVNGVDSCTITNTADSDKVSTTVNGGSLHFCKGITYSGIEVLRTNSGSDETSNYYIESGATIVDRSTEDDFAYASDDNTNIYIYGTTENSDDSSSNYISVADGSECNVYFGVGCEFNGSVSSDAVTYYEVTYIPDSNTKESDTYSSWVESGDTTTIKDLTYTRYGYTQEEWNAYKQTSVASTASTSTTYAFLASVTVTCPIELTPAWSENQSYTLSFNSNGGSSVDSIYANYGADLSDLEPTPTLEGYTFDGWYTDSTLTSLFTFDTMPEEDLTLYAKWEVTEYTITYYVDGGTNSESNDSSYNLNSDDITLINPTKTGYTFKGWYTSSDFSGDAVTTIDVSKLENVELYAKWEINTYTIIYYMDGGTNSESNDSSYNVNSDDITLTNPTKTGYTFKGWYTSSDFTGNAVTTIDVSDLENVELYAKWEINTYTIIYYMDGGTNSESNDSSYNVNSDDITLTNPTKTGYTFKGWYTSSDFSGDAVTTIDVSELENVELYAKWEINTYTITFDSNDGSSVDAITEEYGTDISNMVPKPTREGYTFQGWYTDSDLTDEYTFDTMESSDITLYAKWIANTYTITFDSNEGSSVDSITEDFGTTITSPEDPTLDGYTFAGWYTDSDLTEIFTFDTMPSSNITLYAKWIEVETSDDDLTADITNLTSLLSDSELEKLETIKVVLNTDSSDIDSTDESLIEEYISSMDNSENISEYFVNITIYAVFNDNSAYSVSELQSETTITLTIDSEYTGYSNYGILRCHDSVTEELDSTYDSDSSTLSFSSDEFSTYAIYYVSDNQIVQTSSNTTLIAQITGGVFVGLIIIFIFILFIVKELKTKKKECVTIVENKIVLEKPKKIKQVIKKEENIHKKIKLNKKEINKILKRKRK